jgi:phosphatidylglycerol---prolipoprotein diacylglyceryl transferase
MFPYIDTSNWPFNFTLALVAIALAVGYLIAVRRAQRSGIDREQFSRLGLWVILAALIGAHLAKFVYTGFQLVLIEPAVLFNILNGHASFGSFIGGFIGAVAFLWLHKVPYRDQFRYADAACFALPFSWWIGRVGCYLVHDHPGIRTTSFLGVRYPGGTRYDLGLLEVLFLLALAGVFLLLDRKPRPRGFYYVAFLLTYGTFRFFLDRLHVDPPRYGGWSVDEIAGGIMIVTGILTIFDLFRQRFSVK